MKGPRPSGVSTGILETPHDLTSNDLQISNDVALARKTHKVADLAVPSSDQGKGLRDALDGKKKIVVVAGAGISVSAGVPDFRSKNGLFSGNGGKHMFDVSVYNNNEDTQRFHRMITDLWNITRHAREKTITFYNMLATWAQNGRLKRLYTQNIDCLDILLKPFVSSPSL
ncbi:hypothetical protein FJTKL_04826 [Diaporthe vaccinii]|uniref:Deacetylase sirtuin-type domain-containing protein n=1 Tax=Diaporthe vaccinii TaxID=105482 RepID=A0ABR4DS75_9PEZI